MTRNRQTAWYIALAAIIALSFALPSGAVAQTATNLKCKGCVGKKDLGKKAVTTKAVKKNAIRSKHIQDGAVRPNNLATSAKPAIAVASEDNDDFGIAFTATDTVLRTAVITVPGPGAVIAQYNIWAYNPNIDLRVFCSATTGTSTTSQMKTGADVLAPTGSATVGSIKTFEVADAGGVTVNLVCRTSVGTIRAAYPSLMLLFVPGAQSIVTESTNAESAGVGVSAPD